MIISRYLTKEVITTFSAVTFVLLFVAMSHQFVGLLAKSAAGQIPITLVLKVVGLYIPEFIGTLAPLSLFIAILFAHGRLHTDSEASVLLTCGFSWASLTRITLKSALVIALGVGLLTIWIVPSVTEYREQILADGEAVGVIHAITPGRFQTMEEGQLVFYVEDVDRDDQLKGVFIAQQPKHTAVDRQTAVITATTAEMKEVNNKNEYFLVLKDGHRYTGVPGSADYTVTTFAEYGRELIYASEPVPDHDRLKPSHTLFNSQNAGDKAELQWRFAMPIAVLVLSLIAIPLAKVRPRQGRYAKFLPAVVLFIIYYNSMTVVRRWVGNETLSPSMGIWWVHVVFGVLALLLLAQASGRLAEWRYRFRTMKKNTTGV